MVKPSHARTHSHTHYLYIHNTHVFSVHQEMALNENKKYGKRERERETAGEAYQCRTECTECLF